MIIHEEKHAKKLMDKLDWTNKLRFLSNRFSKCSELDSVFPFLIRVQKHMETQRLVPILTCYCTKELYFSQRKSFWLNNLYQMQGRGKVSNIGWAYASVPPCSYIHTTLRCTLQLVLHRADIWWAEPSPSRAGIFRTKPSWLALKNEVNTSWIFFLICTHFDSLSL